MFSEFASPSRGTRNCWPDLRATSKCSILWISWPKSPSTYRIPGNTSSGTTGGIRTRPEGNGPNGNRRRPPGPRFRPVRCVLERSSEPIPRPNGRLQTRSARSGEPVSQRMPVAIPLAHPRAEFRSVMGSRFLESPAPLRHPPTTRKSKCLSAKVKSCCSEGGSPSSLGRKAPEFRTKELDGKV